MPNCCLKCNIKECKINKWNINESWECKAKMSEPWENNKPGLVPYSLNVVRSLTWYRKTVCGHVEHANKLQVASDLYFLILKSIKTISTSVVFSLLTFIVPVHRLHTQGRDVAQRGWEWPAWGNGRGLCGIEAELARWLLVNIPGGENHHFLDPHSHTAACG